MDFGDEGTRSVNSSLQHSMYQCSMSFLPVNLKFCFINVRNAECCFPFFLNCCYYQNVFGFFQQMSLHHLKQMKALEIGLFIINVFHFKTQI